MMYTPDALFRVRQVLENFCNVWIGRSDCREYQEFAQTIQRHFSFLNMPPPSNETWEAYQARVAQGIMSLFSMYKRIVLGPFARSLVDVGAPSVVEATAAGAGSGAVLVSDADAIALSGSATETTAFVTSLVAMNYGALPAIATAGARPTTDGRFVRRPSAVSSDIGRGVGSTAAAMVVDYEDDFSRAGSEDETDSVVNDSDVALLPNAVYGDERGAEFAVASSALDTALTGSRPARLSSASLSRPASASRPSSAGSRSDALSLMNPFTGAVSSTAAASVPAPAAPPAPPAPVAGASDSGHSRDMVHVAVHSDDDARSSDVSGVARARSGRTGSARFASVGSADTGDGAVSSAPLPGSVGRDGDAVIVGVDATLPAGASQVGGGAQLPVLPSAGGSNESAITRVFAEFVGSGGAAVDFGLGIGGTRRVMTPVASPAAAPLLVGAVDDVEEGRLDSFSAPDVRPASASRGASASSLRTASAGSRRGPALANPRTLPIAGNTVSGTGRGFSFDEEFALPAGTARAHDSMSHHGSPHPDASDAAVLTFLPSAAALGDGRASSPPTSLTVFGDRALATSAARALGQSGSFTSLSPGVAARAAERVPYRGSIGGGVRSTSATALRDAGADSLRDLHKANSFRGAASTSGAS